MSYLQTKVNDNKSNENKNITNGLKDLSDTHLHSLSNNTALKYVNNAWNSAGLEIQKIPIYSHAYLNSNSHGGNFFNSIYAVNDNVVCV